MVLQPCPRLHSSLSQPSVLSAQHLVEVGCSHLRGEGDSMNPISNGMQVSKTTTNITTQMNGSMWNLHGDLPEACVGLGLLQSDETPHELHGASIRTDLADLGVHHQSLEAAGCLCLVQMQSVLQDARGGFDLSSRRVGIASDVQGIHQHVTDGLVLTGGWGLQAVWLNKIINPSIMNSMCYVYIAIPSSPPSSVADFRWN